MGELRDRQVLLTRCLSRFLQYAESQGYEVTLGEAYVANPRKTRTGYVVEDGVHMPRSLHYDRLAIDLNLFVAGEYITDGSHPAWTQLGEHWESLDDLCRWGGRFGDANHVSVAYGGRS